RRIAAARRMAIATPQTDSAVARAAIQQQRDKRRRPGRMPARQRARRPPAAPTGAAAARRVAAAHRRQRIARAPVAVPPAPATADALIKAASNYDEPALAALFGADGKDLVSTDDPVRDKSYALAFAALASDGHALVVSPTHPNRATLQVGREHWPLPVPLVK